MWQLVRLGEGDSLALGVVDLLPGEYRGGPLPFVREWLLQQQEGQTSGLQALGAARGR